MSRRQYREVNGRQQHREMMVARLRVLSKATKGSCARSNGRDPCRTRSRLMQVGLKQSLFSDSRTFPCMCDWPRLQQVSAAIYGLLQMNAHSPTSLISAQSQPGLARRAHPMLREMKCSVRRF